MALGRTSVHGAAALAGALAEVRLGRIYADELDRKRTSSPDAE